MWHGKRTVRAALKGCEYRFSPQISKILAFLRSLSKNFDKLKAKANF